MRQEAKRPLLGLGLLGPQAQQQQADRPGGGDPPPAPGSPGLPPDGRLPGPQAGGVPTTRGAAGWPRGGKLTLCYWEVDRAVGRAQGPLPLKLSRAISPGFLHLWDPDDCAHSSIYYSEPWVCAGLQVRAQEAQCTDEMGGQAPYHPQGHLAGMPGRISCAWSPLPPRRSCPSLAFHPAASASSSEASVPPWGCCLGSMGWGRWPEGGRAQISGHTP